MDLFATIEDLALFPHTPESLEPAEDYNGSDIMQELVNADTKLGYGAICVIS